MSDRDKVRAIKQIIYNSSVGSDEDVGYTRGIIDAVYSIANMENNDEGA